jgi:hypothetical protein
MRNIINSLPIENLQYLFEGEESFLRKLKMDSVSVYSMTPLEASKSIIKIILKYATKKSVITDMTACIGGDTIQFSKIFKHINSIELSKERCKFLKHNIDVYDRKNVTVYQGNSIELIKTLEQDIIYIDPPWGGKKYKYKKKINLYLSKIPMWNLCNQLANQADYIVLKVPLNFNIEFFCKKVISEDVDIYPLKKIQLIIINNKDVDIEMEL